MGFRERAVCGRDDEEEGEKSLVSEEEERRRSRREFLLKQCHAVGVCDSVRKQSKRERDSGSLPMRDLTSFNTMIPLSGAQPLLFDHHNRPHRCPPARA